MLFYLNTELKQKKKINSFSIKSAKKTLGLEGKIILKYEWKKKMVLTCLFFLFFTFDRTEVERDNKLNQLFRDITSLLEI